VLKSYRKLFITTASLSGIAACLVDSISMFILGREIKGYSILHNAMSAMGRPNSPVDHRIDLWWVLMGILFLIFGLGIRWAFSDQKKWGMAASVLIMLYGIGEGLGSALFPEDKGGAMHSFNGILHNLLGSVGIVSITIFILVMAKLIPEYKKFSIVAFLIGIISIVFFLTGHFWGNPNNFFVLTKGLWQRIYVWDYYIFVIAVAIKIISDKNIGLNLNDSK